MASSGDRHLFLQDYNGTIHHAARLASSTVWITKLAFPFIESSPNAKVRTPLAVNFYHDEDSADYTLRVGEHAPLQPMAII